MPYSPQVLEHFHAPRNVGVVDDYQGIGRIGDPGCGDFLEVTLRLTDDYERIDQLRYRIKGCPAAIATSSIASEMAMGATVEEALAITDERIIAALGGLPPGKEHCSLLAVKAIQQAIQDAVLKRLFRKAGIVASDSEFEALRDSGGLTQYFHTCDGSCEEDGPCEVNP